MRVLDAVTLVADHQVRTGVDQEFVDLCEDSVRYKTAQGQVGQLDGSSGRVIENSSVGPQFASHCRN